LSVGGRRSPAGYNLRSFPAIAIGLELEIRFFGKAIDSFRKKIDTTSEKIVNDFG
jgi:hypothetical protein